MIRPYPPQLGEREEPRRPQVLLVPGQPGERWVWSRSPFSVVSNQERAITSGRDSGTSCSMVVRPDCARRGRCWKTKCSRTSRRLEGSAVQLVAEANVVLSVVVCFDMWILGRPDNVDLGLDKCGPPYLTRRTDRRKF